MNNEYAMEALKKIQELIGAMPVDGKEMPEEEAGDDKEGTALVIEAGMPDKGDMGKDGKCPVCGK